MAEPKKPISASQEANADGASELVDETLEHARAFLDDETVKAANPDEKREFLKSKGLSDDQIALLLEETKEESPSSVPPPSTESSTTPNDAYDETDTPSERKEAASSPATGSLSAVSSTPSAPPPVVSPTSESSPPIITYPEFLTKPQRPPPIITPSRLANIIAASGGVWALLYGISGLIVRPMVDDLNDARADYYEHVNGKLSLLVEKLEATVSEVPYKNGKLLKSQQLQSRVFDDNESTTSDPTELFHRDVGTQTSRSPSFLSIRSGTEKINEKPIDAQMRKLSAISSLVREAAVMQTQRTENIADLRASLGEFRDQLDKLASPPVRDFSAYGGFGYGQSMEPDDEFKKTKAAIRSVKGLLLSSRNFPAVSTR